MGRTNSFFRKDNWSLREQKGDKKVYDVCLYKYEWSFGFLQGHTTPGEGKFTVALPPGSRPTPKRKFMAASLPRSCCY